MTQAPDVYAHSPDEDESAEPAEPAESGVAGVERGLGAEGPDDPLRTGDPRVDEVLDSLEALDERPVSEHAAVFERAHEALRAALEPEQESA